MNDNKADQRETKKESVRSCKLTLNILAQKVIKKIVEKNRKRE